MIRHRTSEAGFGHHHTEGMIIVAIIMIIAAVSLPQFLKLRDNRALLCVQALHGRLAGAADGAAECPFSKKPLAVARQSDAETVECPDPDQHLPSRPRFVRAKDGPLRLEQTLPAWSGKPVTMSGLVVKETPDRIAIHVRSGWFVRYVVLSLLALVFVVLTGAIVAAIVVMSRDKDWGGVVKAVIGMAVTGGIAGVLIYGIGSSHEWVLEGQGATLTKVDYRFGRRSSEKAVQGCLGVVPVRKTGGALQLVVIHPPDAEGSRTTPLGVFPEDRLDLAPWLNRTLLASPPSIIKP